MRKGYVFAGLEAFIIIVVYFEATNGYVSIVKAGIFTCKVSIIKASDSIMIMQIVVIELTVCIMPQLIISRNNRFVVMENFQWLCI